MRPPRIDIGSLGGLHGRTLDRRDRRHGQAVSRARVPSACARALRRSAPSPVAGVEIVRDLGAARGCGPICVLAAARGDRGCSTTRLRAREARPASRGTRGELVDQDALRRALDDGRVGLASLDVTDPEPLPAGHWLYSHPRVRFSPHVSWSMPGAFDLLIEPF
jgi:hypothetical protein